MNYIHWFQLNLAFYHVSDYHPPCFAQHFATAESGYNNYSRKNS